ncbi:MAG: hypothetical protein OEY61_04955 [Gammaproteobacteria bacterium]|nr:hypothetical protein [Gammaproteobacteria bacterium]
MLNLKKRLMEGRTSSRYISPQGTEVTILFSSENPSLIGQTIHTQAIEISPKGIRLEIDHEISINSVLDIAVKVNGNERAYHLTGNVRWRVPTICDNHYQIGLILRERNDIRSDLKAWKANFKYNFTYEEAI